MYVSRSVFYTLVCLDAGLMGATLHGSLDGAARAVEAVWSTHRLAAAAPATGHGTAPANVIADQPRLATAALPTMTIRIVVERGTPSEQRAQQHQLASSNRRADEDEKSLRDGNTFLVAYDGSIVLVGDSASLTANTGSSSASGNIAVGVEGSLLATGASARPANAASRQETQVVDVVAPDQGSFRPLTRVAVDRTGVALRTGVVRRHVTHSNASQRRAVVQGMDSTRVMQLQRLNNAIQRLSRARALYARRGRLPATDGTRPPRQGAADSLSHANGSFAVSVPPDDQTGGVGVAFSGFEDHSVSAIGNDQILTYDDSNVFLNRNGKINANTGDTDSSGLNAVDVSQSRVRSGNSGDMEDCEDEEEEPAQPQRGAAGEDEEGEQPAGQAPSTPGRPQAAPQQMVPGRGTGVATTPMDPSQPTIIHVTNPLRSHAHQRPGARRVHVPRVRRDTVPEEDGAKDVQIPDVKDGQSFATVTDEGTSAAIGNTTFVVGADGFDDVSIRSRGDGNVVTYDDSNLIVGGTGPVNAQIGDSDTGGAVVMDIHDADVSAGCEGDMCYFLPRKSAQGGGATTATTTSAGGSSTASVLRWTGRVDGEVRIAVRDEQLSYQMVTGKPAEDVQAAVGSLWPRPQGAGQLEVAMRGGRGSVSILEQPSVFNNFTTVVRITDPQRGYGAYDFDVVWKPSAANGAGP